MRALTTIMEYPPGARGVIIWMITLLLCFAAHEASASYLVSALANASLDDAPDRNDKEEEANEISLRITRHRELLPLNAHVACCLSAMPQSPLLSHHSDSRSAPLCPIMLDAGFSLRC